MRSLDASPKIPSRRNFVDGTATRTSKQYPRLLPTLEQLRLDHFGREYEAFTPITMELLEKSGIEPDYCFKSPEMAMAALLDQFVELGIDGSNAKKWGKQFSNK